MIPQNPYINVYTDVCVRNFDKVILFGQYEKGLLKKLGVKGKAGAPPILTFACGERISPEIKYLRSGVRRFCLVIPYDDRLFEQELLLKIESYTFACNPLKLINRYDVDFLDKDTSAVITTMVKDYGHRLDEWIAYNLKIGFDAVILYDNSSSNHKTCTFRCTGEVGELVDNQPRAKRDISYLKKKYGGKVIIIPFDYEPQQNLHWCVLQFVCNCVTATWLSSRCKYIAYFDADEFIYIYEDNNIKKFLNKHDTPVTIKNMFLTNKSTSEVIDNNVLAVARYASASHETKFIYNTTKSADSEYVLIGTPHKHPEATVIPKSDVCLFHIHLNNRRDYHPSLEKINVLYEFFHN